MEIYTVIQYVFGQTKLIYSGVNKDTAYQILQADEDNYLHVWENDQEIRREGRGIDNKAYEQYMLQNSTVHTLINRIDCSSLQVQCSDWVNEENHLWMECEYESDDVIVFEFSLEKERNDELTLRFGCTEEDEKELQSIFNQTKEMIANLLSDKFVVIQDPIITKKPLANNPY